MPSPNSNSRHATLYDFRDLDLMLKIDAEGDRDGWIESGHLARALGFGDETNPVTRRLSWMRRYGMLNYDAEKKLWRLSPGGRRVTEARLRSATSRQIADLPDESFIEVMTAVTDRYWKGDPMTAAMLRREFAYGTQKRG